MSCLTLNASYEPMRLIPLQRAMRLVLEGKAEIVEADPERAVRTSRLTMPRPVVIRLTRYVHVPRRLRRQVTNLLLFARDGYACAYCGRHERALSARRGEFLNRDHVVPLSHGGTNAWENCVTACSACNTRKADRTPAEAGMTLRVVPTAPHFVHLVWTVRRLTPLQRQYVRMFYGAELCAALFGEEDPPPRAA